jgi:hypothetical protein
VHTPQTEKAASKRGPKTFLKWLEKIPEAHFQGQDETGKRCVQSTHHRKDKDTWLAPYPLEMFQQPRIAIPLALTAAILIVVLV